MFGKWLAVSGAITLLALAGSGAEPASPGPLSPRDEQATFRVPKGFRVELVASEPEVVDPVAMAFDENGRIYVAEMHGYPNGGIATGQIGSGKIKLLEDANGDGIYEKATVFAEGLRFPTSVMPWRGGLLTANLADVDTQSLRLASLIRGREPVVIWNHARNVTRLPLAPLPQTPGIRAIEIVNGSPKDIDALRANREQLLTMRQHEHLPPGELREVREDDGLPRSGW